MNELLQRLRSYPEFELVMAEVKQQKPVIPVYDPVSDNTEEWKSLSNQRKGFELLLTLLGEQL